MAKLRHPYPQMEKDGCRVIGGNQRWASDAALARCGCGVVAGLDLALYLTNHPAEQPCIPWAQYDGWLARLRARFLPLLPGIGLDGFTLARGMNRLFAHLQLPYRAKWGVRKKLFWPRIEAMLANDIPVVLGVGMNFPKFWQKNKLPLHNAQHEPVAGARAHYVTIRALEGETLTISSWGQTYFVEKPQLEQYIKTHSNYVLSNVLWVERRENP